MGHFWPCWFWADPLKLQMSIFVKPVEQGVLNFMGMLQTETRQFNLSPLSANVNTSSWVFWDFAENAKFNGDLTGGIFAHFGIWPYILQLSGKMASDDKRAVFSKVPKSTRLTQVQTYPEMQVWACLSTSFRPWLYHWTTPFQHR